MNKLLSPFVADLCALALMLAAFAWTPLHAPAVQRALEAGIALSQITARISADVSWLLTRAFWFSAAPLLWIGAVLALLATLQGVTRSVFQLVRDHLNRKAPQALK